MPEKDHLTTSYSNAKRESKEIRNLVSGIFISNDPPQSETITDTGIDLIADTVNSIDAPVQGAFNDLGANTAATVEVLLDKVNAGVQAIQLPAIDEMAINFSNLVTNKFQRFILDLTKADNETTPTVTFTPHINGLTQDEINENNRICVEVLAIKKEGGVTLDVLSGGGGGGAGGEFFGPWTALHDGGKQQLSNLSAVLFSSGTEEYSGAIKSVAETGVIVTVPDSHSFQIRSGSLTSNNIVLEFDNTNGLDLRDHSAVRVGSIGFSGTTGKSITSSGQLDLNFTVPLTGDMSFRVGPTTYLETNSEFTRIDIRENLYFPTNRSILGITGLTFLTANSIIINAVNNDLTLTVPTGGNISFKEGANHTNMIIDGAANRVQFNGDIRMLSSASTITDLNTLNFSDNHEIKSSISALEFHIDDSTDKFSFIYENSDGDNTEIISINSGGLNLNSSGLGSVGLLSGVSSIGFTNTAVSISNALTDLNFQVPSGGDIRFRESTATILELNGTSNTIIPHRNIAFNSSASSMTNLGTLGFSGTTGKSIVSSGTVNMNISVPTTGDIALRVGTSEYLKIDGGLGQVRFRNSINMISGAPFNHISGVGALNIEGSHKIEGLSTSLNFHIGASTDKFAFIYENSGNVDTEILSIDSGGLKLNSSGLGSVGLLSGVSGIGFTNTGVSITNALTDLNFQVPLGGDIRFRESTATILELNGTNNTIRPHRNIVFNSSTSSITNLGTLGFAGTAGKSIVSSGTVDMNISVPLTGDIEFRVGTSDYMKIDGTLGQVRFSNSINMISGAPFNHISGVGAINIEGSHKIEGLSTALNFHIGASTDKFSFYYENSSNVDTEILSIDSGGLNLNSSGLGSVGLLSGVSGIGFTNTGVSITNALTDLNFQVPSGGDIRFREATATILELNGTNDTIRAHRNIVFNSSTSSMTNLGTLGFAGTTGKSITSSGLVDLIMAVPLTGDMSFRVGAVDYIKLDSSDTEVEIHQNITMAGTSVNSNINSISGLGFSDGHFIRAFATSMQFDLGATTDRFSFVYGSTNTEILHIDSNGLDLNGLTLSNAQLGAISHLDFTNSHYIDSDPTELHLVVDGSTDSISLGYSPTDTSIVGIANFSWTNGLNMLSNDIINAGAISGVSGVTFTGTAGKSITSSGNLNLIMAVPSSGDMSFRVGTTDYIKLDSSATEIEMHQKIIMAGNSVSSAITSLNNLGFTDGHFIRGFATSLQFDLGASTDRFSFVYGSSNTEIMHIDSNGIDMNNNTISNFSFGNVPKLDFTNSHYIDSDPNEFHIVVDGSSDTIAFGYSPNDVSITGIANLSFTSGLNMLSNNIINAGSISGISSLNFATQKSIVSSSNDITLNVPSGGDIVFREFGTLFMRMNGLTNNVELSRDIDMNSNDIEDIGKLEFGETDQEIKPSGSNIVYQVPSGDDHVFEEGNFEFMRMNGGTNNIEFERNIVLNNGRSIRSDSSAEIGFFVTDDTDATGSRGSIQIPTSSTQTVSSSILNARFGGAIGCIGFIGQGGTATGLAIKNTSSNWVVLTFPSDGTVTAFTTS